MSFKTTNELEHFLFEDCVISNFKVQENSIALEVDGLIILPNNSQNTNYTESYADTASILFTNAKLLSGIKDGYKYYDANEVLVDEVPDQPLSDAELSAFVKNTKGAYLFAIDEGENYILSIEIPNEDEYDTSTTETYQITLSADSISISWERYLNRVQR